MTAPPSLDPPAWAPPPPPPLPPGPPPRPPLARSGTDKVIGGVSGGLAEYTGIDALLWRVGFVALAFAGGTGVLVYLLLWLLMPVAAGWDPGTGPVARRSAPAGPRSPVPGVTIAVLFIVLGLLALLARLTSWDPDGRVFVSAALLVVGLGLVALALTGGRRGKGGLIALGAVLSMGLLASTTQPWEDVEGGVGDRTYTPETAGEVRPVYDHGMGNLTLDLTDIDLADLDEPVTTRIDHGMGDIEVLVPDSADVRVEVDGGMGDVDILDLDSDGGLSAGEGSSWSGDGEAEIVLTIDSGMGNVEVSRA